MPSDDTRTPRVPLGPVGRYVVDNLKQLREARRLTYKELSDRLKALGRPIPPLGLSRIEKEDRRVDADDLVALAFALGVNPTALLLPRDVLSEAEIQLTESQSTAAAAAWAWMDGRTPMLHGVITDDDRSDFMKHARPVWARTPSGAPQPDWSTEHQLASLQEQLDELKAKWQATQEPDDGQPARPAYTPRSGAQEVSDAAETD